MLRNILQIQKKSCIGIAIVCQHFWFYFSQKGIILIYVKKTEKFPIVLSDLGVEAGCSRTETCETQA